MTLFTLTSTQRCAQPELADLADGARSQVRTQLPQRSDLLYQTMEPWEMIGNYDRVSAVGAMTLAAKRWFSSPRRFGMDYWSMFSLETRS